MNDFQRLGISADDLTGITKALISQTTVVETDGGWTFKSTSATQDYFDQLERTYGAGCSLVVSGFVAQMHHLIRRAAEAEVEGSDG